MKKDPFSPIYLTYFKTTAEVAKSLEYTNRNKLGSVFFVIKVDNKFFIVDFFLYLCIMNKLLLVNAIMDNLRGRRGYRQEFEQLEDDIISEIESAWLLILNTNLSAEESVNKIIYDINSRGGIDYVWDTIDEDIQDEIKMSLITIIKNHEN